MSWFLVLLSILPGLLGETMGLLAAECDSTPDDLLLLEDAQYKTESMPVDRSVTLEGVIKNVHSPQNFFIQVGGL